MKTKFVLSVVSFLIVSLESGLVIQAGEIRFGVAFNTDHSNRISGTMLDSLSDSLGFNFCFPMADTLSEARLNFFRQDHGLDVIPYMCDPVWPDVVLDFKGYLNSHYAVIQAEDETWPVRFQTRNNGYREGDSMYVALRSDTPFVFLDNLYYDHERSYTMGVVQYQPFLRMRVDSLLVPTGDTLAYLKVWRVALEWFNEQERHHYVIKEYPILSDSFLASNPHEIYFDPPFTIPDGLPRNVVTYQIKSTGHCQFAIDSFAVYNQNGHDIMTGRYDNHFIQYIQAHQNVLYWQLRDDIHYDMLLPARHMDQLIRTYSNTCGLMKAWFSAFSGYYAYEGPYGGRFPFREFLRIAQPKRTDLNQYPFWDGKQGSDSCSGGIKTLYYGDSTYDDGFHQGLQSRIEDGVTDVLDSIMPLLIADSIQLGYAAQGQTQGKYYCDTYFMRRPTGSEMSMEAFIALSYGVKDIWYWPFGTEPGASGDLYVGLDSCYYFDRCRVTQAWERIQNHVTRNLQALSAYLGAAGMHWERSYDSHHIGQAAYLSSIYGWSDSPNPDSGWAQIGEFHNDSTGDKYILLVNRACSRDDIGTEAPDQHFVLRFNPTTIGSDYVFINDLAHTVHYDSTAHEWVGDSLVTYSAKMPDNKIPYTITLRAGEGKLLKIVPTSQIQLSGTVNTNYTYQGKISVTGDATVAGGHTMRIKGPARIEVVRCHSVKLVGNGRLEALGTIGDSVKFVSDTTAYCDHGVHPLPGDWYGIYINESASCSLSYCCVDYASYGIECRTASHVTILNTNVSNNETAGIYNYKGYLTVRYSAINGNGTYGVYGYMADNIIYGSRLLANNSYGIALTYWRSMDSTRIEYDTIASAPMVSQHGIFISSNDRVRIYKCKVGSYAQGGIHLYDSNALITNNDFSANQTYGIYADNYSFPKIRQCRLDTLPLGVKT